MNKIKVAYIISNISKVIMFEWISNSLDRKKFELIFIFLNETEPEVFNYLQENGFKCYLIRYRTKKDIPISTIKVIRILFSNKIKILHAHLFDASLVGLLAAFILKIPKRIHTRHHSDFHHIYFPTAVKYDNLINWLSTDIIVISKNVFQLLIEKEKYVEGKIKLIYHGFDISSFEKREENKIISMQEKWKINPTAVKIGMVSRLIKWKGVDYAIEGFKKLYNENNNIQLIIANAKGEPDYVSYIHSLVEILPKNTVIFIDYENDMPTLYHSFSIFLHTPEDETCEAFGQVYIEAMAAKTPSVVTLSGIAVEYIEDRQQSLVVEFKSSDSIYEKLKEIIADDALKTSLVDNGYQKVKSMFSLESMTKQLEKIYSE
jgi:glycosyltransferase involved in cell wall biosynthesis